METAYRISVKISSPRENIFKPDPQKRFFYRPSRKLTGASKEANLTSPALKIPKIKTTADMLSFKNAETTASPREEISRKIIVPALKLSSKESRSLSPGVRLNLKQDEIENAKIVRKYRRMRVEDQEKEIQLCKLCKSIEEEIEKTGENHDSKIAALLIKLAELSFVNGSMESEFMTRIPKLLENYLFCADERICSKITSIFDIKGFKIKNMIFPHLIDKLCKRAELKKLQSKSEIDSLLAKIETLERDFMTKSSELMSYTQNSHSNENAMKLQFEKDIIKMKDRLISIESEKTHLITVNNRLADELRQTSESLNKEKVKLERDFNHKISDLESKNRSFAEKLEIIQKELSEQRTSYHTLFENYKRSMIFLKSLKDKIEKKDQEISELMNENQKLKVRAATAWEELTPRPSFKCFSNFLDIEESFFLKKPTAKIVEDLSKICQDHYINSNKDFQKLKRQSDAALIKRAETFKSEQGGSTLGTPNPSPKSRWSRFKEDLSKITLMKEKGRFFPIIEKKRSISCENDLKI